MGYNVSNVVLWVAEDTINASRKHKLSDHKKEQ